MIVVRGRTLRLTALTLSCIMSLGFHDSPHIPSALHFSQTSEKSLSGKAAATDFDDYIWPTDAGKIVTSTFGEFRATHFHAGIDISSGDLTGYKVFAARRGYVSRILVSPEGYGKMLFIRHPDGFTTTYAHLARFFGGIEDRARAEQKKLQRYPVDIGCDSTEFPVRKGELVAYSGATGTGSPHLHFEIRDPDMNPLNPFLAPRLRVYDTIPPMIRKVAVRPIETSSTVDGQNSPGVYRAYPAGEGRYRIPHTILTSGPVGFAVSVRDRINGSRFRNGVYANSLSIDGKQVYNVRMQHTPAQETQEIGLYYDWDLLDEGEGRFEKLYMESPNTLDFYSPPGPWSGILDDIRFGSGTHMFNITCKDFSGNSAQVTGKIVICRAPAFEATRSIDTLRLRFFEPEDVSSVHVADLSGISGEVYRTWKADPGHPLPSLSIPLGHPTPHALSITVTNRWGIPAPPEILAQDSPFAEAAVLSLSCTPEENGVLVRLHSAGIIAGLPSVFVTEGPTRATVLVSAIDAHTASGWFIPGSFRGARTVQADAYVNGRPVHATTTCTMYPILPGASDSLVLESGKIIVRYDTSSVFKPLPFWIEPGEGEEGPTYILQPEGVVLRSGLTVTLRADDVQKHRALYFRTRQRWHLIGGWQNQLNTGRLTRATGEVALLVDDTPPVIRRLSITKTSPRKPRITFRYSDDRSGVEYNELKMYIDNVSVIPEIDGEHRKVVYQAPDPLDRGSHQLTIRLMDRMGNLTKAERRFVLR